MNRFIPALLVVFAVLSGCGQSQTEKDEELILAYIADNNLDAQSTSQGLYYVVDSVGSGEQPASDDNVTVDYEGYLLDGDKFDSSLDRGMPLTFDLVDVIAGWQIGIPLFQEGGAGKLIIPSRLAYGPNGVPGIPPHSVLIFDVHLISVN